MNKQQARLAWVGVILLSLVAIIIGLMIAMGAGVYSSRTYTRDFVLGIIVGAGIPIMLNFGFAFIRAGQKAKHTDQSPTKKV